MPMYGGTLGTGLILWKGVRLNNGETGPMFGGENGGTGVLTNAEQQGLVDYHEILPFPLNPNLDPVTGQYSAQAALGKDLYFGTNTTGLNPTGRNAGCVACHPDAETNPFANPGPRFYTADFIDPTLTHGEMLASLDPDCVTLRENFVTINMRNVNSGANVDVDGDSIPDTDRNFDGFDDRETYAVMNRDKDDPFLRDDHNSWLCPCDPQIDPNCDVNNPIGCSPARRFPSPSPRSSACSRAVRTSTTTRPTRCARSSTPSRKRSARCTAAPRSRSARRTPVC